MADEERQLLRGTLRLLLLELIGQDETYGYELVVALRRHGLSQVGESTVYPALSRLERDGMLAARLEASGRGAARKYYRLTAAGERARRETRTSWDRIVGALDAIAAPEQESSDAAP